MTWEDYEQVRKARPELLLRAWWRIAPHFRDHLLTKTVDELVAARTYTMLARKDWRFPEVGSDGIQCKVPFHSGYHASYKEV